MITLDDTLAEAYLAESREHLAEAEAALLALEQGRGEDDRILFDRFRRVFHAIQEGAGAFDLVEIRRLAGQVEEVLESIRTGGIARTSACVSLLLRATDVLLEMFENPGLGNRTDHAEISAALVRLQSGQPPADPAQTAEAAEVSEVTHVAPADRPGEARPGLRVLLVEDDFVSRILLHTFLSRHGECHIAVNGREAVEAFRSAADRGEPYQLICMDIRMPEMDGREAVRQIRAIEESVGTLSTLGAKIFMITTVREIKEVTLCFRELCDAYLVKPVDLGELQSRIRSFQLIG